MITDKEKQSHEELFRLMRENPDLPVVPMVDYEVVWDGYGRWAGSWGKARIDEYLIDGDSYKIWFKSENDPEDVLEDVLSYEDYTSLPDNDDERKQAYNALPWIKAIIVDVNLPD